MKLIWNYPILGLIQGALVLIGAPIFLCIDSAWLSQYCSWTQDFCNILMFGFYCSLLLTAKERLFWLMLLMTVTGLIAEVLCSLVLNLYQYRLHNIPVYIPLGHAVIYAIVYYFSNHPLVWRFHRPLEQYLAKIAFIIVFISLCMLQDVAGFLFYILFLFILKARKKPLFGLIMFLTVYYIDIFGTIFSSWNYYGYLGTHPLLPHVARVPSGIGGIYLMLDMISNSIYYYTKKTGRHFRYNFGAYIKGTKSITNSMLTSPPRGERGIEIR